MEFGVQFFPDVRPEQKSAAEYFRDALRLAGQKLPIKTKFVRREGGDLFAG